LWEKNNPIIGMFFTMKLNKINMCYWIGSNRTLYGFDSGFDTIGLAVSLLGQAYGSNFVIVITGPTNLTPLKLRLVSHFAPKYIASVVNFKWKWQLASIYTLSYLSLTTYIEVSIIDPIIVL
jgi:hypothetical protein